MICLQFTVFLAFKNKQIASLTPSTILKLHKLNRIDLGMYFVLVLTSMVTLSTSLLQNDLDPEHINIIFWSVLVINLLYLLLWVTKVFEYLYKLIKEPSMKQSEPQVVIEPSVEDNNPKIRVEESPSPKEINNIIYSPSDNIGTPRDIIQ